MKLNEVLDKEISGLKQTDKEIGRVNEPLNKKGKWNKLGYGLQAAAYSPTSKPESVVKLVNISGSDDPSYQFLRLCLKHQDNPYFPKIYNVKKYRLQTGESQQVIRKYKLVVTMEKLHKFTLSDTPILERLLRISFRRFQDNSTASRNLQQIFQDPSWRKEVYKTTTDKDLKQALRLLEPLFRHYRADMYFGNIMLRGTGTGASSQLVIIDPTA